VTASPYSPLVTFSMASRRSAPFAAPPPSSGTGTTTAMDVPAGACVSSLTHPAVLLLDVRSRLRSRRRALPGRPEMPAALKNSAVR